MNTLSALSPFPATEKSPISLTLQLAKFLSQCPETALGPMIAKLKGTASLCCRDIPALMWNRRCYDHDCRSISSVREKIVYCHNNPIRRELVANASDWRWSSAAWYEGKRDVSLVIDEFELWKRDECVTDFAP